MTITSLPISPSQIRMLIQLDQSTTLPLVRLIISFSRLLKQFNLMVKKSEIRAFEDYFLRFHSMVSGEWSNVNFAWWAKLKSWWSSWPWEMQKLNWPMCWSIDVVCPKRIALFFDHLKLRHGFEAPWKRGRGGENWKCTDTTYSKPAWRKLGIQN